MYNERKLTNHARALRRHQTIAEGKLWSELRNRQLEGTKLRRQLPVGSYIVDFACWELGLVVELDGDQHADNPYDKVRTAALNENGFRVIRFWNHEVFEDLDGVVETIRLQIFDLMDAADQHRKGRINRPPSPLPPGRGLKRRSRFRVRGATRLAEPSEAPPS